MPIFLSPPNASPVLSIETGGHSSLAHLLWTHLPPRPLCLGLGRCGMCQVRFLSDPPPALPEEKEILGDDACANNIRLACRHTVTSLSKDIFLELPGEAFEEKRLTSHPLSCTHPIGLALDIGTTSVCWAFLDLREKNVLSEGSFLNPLMAQGSDVISRLSAALNTETRSHMAKSMRKAILGLLDSIKCPTKRILLCANTVMTDIFLDYPIENLAFAPCVLSHCGHERLSLPHFPPIFLPPLIAPFIGSDIACGLHFCLERNPPRPWLLADLGTNTEFCLQREDGELFFTSVPMGPAMEGIGMRCGMLAGEHAVTRFFLSPLGLLLSSPDAKQSSFRGISATGYISLLGLLLRVHVLNEQGSFQKPSMPLAQKITSRLFQKDSRPCLALSETLFLDSLDIEEMLKVKAAFSSAITLLLEKAGLSRDSLRTLFLGGALGSAVDISDLETLGFLPQGFREKIAILGNCALEGAKSLLLSPRKEEALAKLCQKSHSLSLTDEPRFQETFLRAMRFGSSF